MVKSSKSRTRSRKKTATQVSGAVAARRRRAPRPMMARFSEYAKLLTNPCTGPLVHAPGSTSGGLVTRFESDFIVGSGATETCGFFQISPGALNSATTPPQGFGSLVGFAATDGTVVFPSTGGAGLYVPGITYLQANASSFRCIAACTQIYWPGTELNRSGLVSAAQTTYSALSGVTGLTVATLRSQCPVVERMPTEYFEAKWAPNYTDGLFRNASATTVPEDGHSSILLTWAGIPVSTGVRIRVVCVYEWNPKILGLTINSNTSNSEAGAIQDVRRSLDRENANWWVSMGHAAYNFMSGVSVAYMNSRGPNFRNQRSIEL